MGLVRISEVTVCVAAMVSGSPVPAQMPVNPAYNGAILKGPDWMSQDIRLDGGSRVCGQAYGSDAEKARLLALGAAGECGAAPTCCGRAYRNDSERAQLLALEAA